MSDQGFFIGNPTSVSNYYQQIVRYTDGTYLHHSFRWPSSLFNSYGYQIYPETYTETASSTYVSESGTQGAILKKPGGVSVAAGCGRIVTNGYVYDYYGNQVSTITSGTVAVGSNRIVSVNSSTQTGYIYDLEGNQLATFTPFTGGYWGSTYTTNETNQNFGVSVSVGCGRIVVGADLWDGPVSASNLTQSLNNVGTAYIYDLDGNQIKKIESPHYQAGTAPGTINALSSKFGCSVAVGNGRIVVGASNHKGVCRVDAQGTIAVAFPGKAFVYNLHGVFMHELVYGGDPVDGDEFGFSVAIGCGKIVVGVPVPGLARVYERTGDFITGLRKRYIDSYSRFGCSVAIKNDVIAVGAEEDDFWDKGVVGVYNLRYLQIHQLTKSAGLSNNELFGKNVAIGGNLIVVSHDNPGNEIYGYRIDPSSNSYWENITDGYSYY